MIARRASIEDAKAVLRYVVPVGEIERYIDHAISIVTPFLDPKSLAA
jgi:hypothetical protein